MSNYTGIYRGAVQDINDPEDRGRLRLLIPAVTGDAVTGWAEPSLPSKKLPRWSVGDRVWAIFEDGDLNRPVYLARQVVHPEDLGDDFEAPRSMTYCGTDNLTVTDRHTIFSSCVKYLSHSDIVEDEALEVFINGTALSPDWWTLDSVNGIVRITLPDWVREGAYIRFGYWWRSENTTSEPPTVPVQPTLVNTTKVTAGYLSPTRSVALPAGTTEGMLLLFAAASGYGVQSTCTDYRMTEIPGVADVWTRGCGLWYGYANGDTSPLDIYIEGNNNAIGQFAIGMLGAFNGVTAPIGMAGYTLTPESSSTTGPILAPPGGAHSAIGVYYASGGIGGVYGLQNWGKTAPYTVVADHDSSYVEIDFLTAFNASSVIGNATTPNTDSGSGWGAVTLAMYEEDA